MRRGVCNALRLDSAVYPMWQLTLGALPFAVDPGGRLIPRMRHCVQNSTVQYCISGGTWTRYAVRFPRLYSIIQYRLTVATL